MKRLIVLTLALLLSIFFMTTIYAQSPARTPNIIKLGSISEKYTAVSFNHSKHASMAADCGMCHHQHGNNGSLPCKECHAVGSSAFRSSVVNNFMACSNCHSTLDPDNPRIVSLKVAYHSVCFQCHRGMGNVGIDPKGCTEMCHAPKEKKLSKK